MAFGLLPIDATAQTPCSGAAIQALVGEIQTAVQANNRAAALEHLSTANDCLRGLTNRPPPHLIDEEALRWDIAQLNFDRADDTNDDRAIGAFANESVRRWQDYIKWFDDLSEPDRQVLASRSDSYRIKLAVQQLGKAIVRRAGRASGVGISDLFSEYAAIPQQHHSHRSIEYWRYWLLRCPDWTEPQTLSIPDPRTERSLTSCREPWLVFRDYLEVWMASANINEVHQRTFARWIRELNDALQLHGP